MSTLARESLAIFTYRIFVKVSASSLYNPDSVTTMIAPVPIVLREKSHPLLLRLGAFTLHTFAVYLSGLFALWLVRMWFGVLAPVLHIHSTVRPGDWYL